MSNDMVERLSSSTIMPKREPIENEFVYHNTKRRFGEHLPHDTDPIISTKRQMATKKHQHIDAIQSKNMNGTSEEQNQKQIESHLISKSPKLNNQKSFSNGSIIDVPSPPSNAQSKPR